VDERIDRAIVTLNSLQMGDVDRILVRLEQVSELLRDLSQEALVQSIQEAHEAIRQADLPLFRKRVQHVVSRLGHLR
jgi:cobalamin biosynthesis protein CobD/CbiB